MEDAGFALPALPSGKKRYLVWALRRARQLAQAPAMTISVDLSLRGRGTEELSLVRHFDDPHSGRMHVLLCGSHPCEAQCKIRLGAVEALALPSTAPAGW